MVLDMNNNTTTERLSYLHPGERYRHIAILGLQVTSCHSAGMKPLLHFQLLLVVATYTRSSNVAVVAAFDRRRADATHEVTKG
jgi:hypothetical protein